MTSSCNIQIKIKSTTNADRRHYKADKQREGWLSNVGL